MDLQKNEDSMLNEEKNENIETKDENNTENLQETTQEVLVDNSNKEPTSIDLEPKKETSLAKEVKDFLKDLVFIVVIVFIIRTFIILPFQISGQSMYDSYYNREFIIVDRFSYLTTLKAPSRWDVIVFDTHIADKEYFIKRIVGLPGEVLKIEKWLVYIKKVWENDFTLLDEKYLSSDNYNATYVNWDDKEFVYTVPEWKYFVMWDNRNASTDSRACFGSCSYGWKSNFIDKSDIVWRVLIDLWYFNFKTLSFNQPELAISSKPRFFNSPSTYDYK